MINNILLSIIVPFYNVEKFIEECIHSIFNQDIPIDKYEVLFVNDCSTDSSESIVRKLQKKYPSLVLINLEKKLGIGAARNKGIILAKGEYLWFVDSDDFIKANVLKNLLKVAFENSLDVLHFGYNRIYENGEILEFPVDYISNIVDGNTFFFDERTIWWKNNVEVWRRLHRRLFLINNELRFSEETYVYEDIIFSVHIFNIAQRVMNFPTSPYYYRFNQNSYLNSAPSGQKLFALMSSSMSCLDLYDTKQLDNRYRSIIKELTLYQFKEIQNILPTLNIEEQFIFLKKTKILPLIKIKKILKWHDYLYFKNGIIRRLMDCKKTNIHKLVSNL